ncbi:MAG: hypothetical protein O3C40_13235 [Planctomycetota bacterium]|nr:hypothetical protein [Planctomycetota bacterium]
MTNRGCCEFIGSPQLAFWFKTRVTLATGLMPDQVCERLKGALPRMVVPPDAGVVFPVRIPIKRVYGGRVHDDTFTLNGPFGKHTGAKLSIRGTIERRADRSLIHLTIYPAGSIFGLILAWLAAIILPCLWWMLDGAFSAPPLYLGGFVGIVGTGSYPLGLIGVPTQLGYLLNYLQALFSGDGPAGIPPRRF